GLQAEDDAADDGADAAQLDQAVDAGQRQTGVLGGGGEHGVAGDAVQSRPDRGQPQCPQPGAALQLHGGDRGRGEEGGDRRGDGDGTQQTGGGEHPAARQRVTEAAVQRGEEDERGDEDGGDEVPGGIA